MMATNVVAEDWNDVDPKIWSPKYIALFKIAAQDTEVERVLVNPAIKKALCRDVKGDRSWLHKMRPVFGHNYHFHVRIGCPTDSNGCKAQPGAAGRRRLRQGSRLVVRQGRRAASSSAASGSRCRCRRCRWPAAKCCWRSRLLAK